jgi:molecular chaperone DnaJ
MAEQVNYYEVLGVPREASQEEIRNAYRRLAKDRHPDRMGGSTEEFSLLQEAHAVLSDPNRRRTHDEALDLAHAADQLSGLDFGSLEDELAARRQERESSGPPLGERLRGRFSRKEKPPRGREDVRRRGRYEIRDARWYEPHQFDPEPVNWRTGAISFVGAFVAFIAAGQIGLWALGAVDAGPLAFVQPLAPFLPVLYSLVGLVAAYFAYRAAGYAGLALVFVAVLVVGGQGQPEGLLQFGTLGIILLLVAIWLGNRRERAAR